MPMLLSIGSIGNKGEQLTSSTRQPIPVFIEKKNLTPCNDYVCERIINARLRSLLLSKIFDFLVCEDITVVLSDEAFANARVVGDTHFLNNRIWEITLNTNALQQASQEYIAATIIHELLHVYLMQSTETDHDIMSRQYIKPMAVALMSSGYAISYERAQALAWGGLQNTRAWHEMRLIDRVLRTYQAQEILNTNYFYATGKMGVPCP